MAKLLLTSLGQGLVVGLWSLSRKEYPPCEKGNALVAVTLCRRLSERIFVLAVIINCLVGSATVCSYTAGSLRAVVSSWARGTAHASATRRCSEAQPWAIFLTCPCLPRAVPRRPSAGRCDRARTWVCCGRPFTSELKKIKNFPNDRQLCAAGSHDPVSLKPKIRHSSYG